MQEPWSCFQSLGETRPSVNAPGFFEKGRVESEIVALGSRKTCEAEGFIYRSGHPVETKGQLGQTLFYHLRRKKKKFAVFVTF